MITLTIAWTRYEFRPRIGGGAVTSKRIGGSPAYRRRHAVCALRRRHLRGGRPARRRRRDPLPNGPPHREIAGLEPLHEHVVELSGAECARLDKVDE